MWEYTVIDLPLGADSRGFTDFLNVLGDAGWELVCVFGNQGILKRPKRGQAHRKG